MQQDNSEQLGEACGALFGIYFIVPFLFWLVWTYFGIGKLFYMLPESFQSIGFWHIFGICFLFVLIFGIIKRMFK